MGVYIVKNGSEFTDASLVAAGINVYLAAYKSGAGRLGFDCMDSGNERALNSLKHEDSRYFSVGNCNIVADPEPNELLGYFRNNLKLGAFLFVGVEEAFNRYTEEIDAYNKYLKKKKIMERHNKSITVLSAPTLMTLYNNQVLEGKALKALLNSCFFCVQARYSDFGLYLYIFSLHDLREEEMFSIGCETVASRADITCW